MTNPFAGAVHFLLHQHVKHGDSNQSKIASAHMAAIESEMPELKAKPAVRTLPDPGKVEPRPEQTATETKTEPEADKQA